MDFDEMIAILEGIKDELLVPIDGNNQMLDVARINNEGINHGVMQMYYRTLLEVYKARNREIDRRATA